MGKGRTMENLHMKTVSQGQPCGVHLVGSIPLADAEDVFRTVSTILGSRLRRIPDGETGERKNWINWQFRFLANNPQLEVIPPEPHAYVQRPRFKLRSSNIHFEQLGYAEVAMASFTVFSRIKQAGLIPAHCRFQVSLPTPLALAVSFLVPQDQAAAEPAYEAAMLAELDTITSALPQDEVAIQWDTPIEFALLESVMPSFFADTKTEILERLVRLGKRVPSNVELGYHLCYGDAGHTHFKEPEDSANMVAVANAISTDVTRPVNWIHMPVPRERTDDAYFAPLRTLQLQPETEVYLGLVHLTDGVEGTLRRIATAQRYLANFGVAAECGFGRRPAETIPDLLRIHHEVASPILS
jgi:hypothetical protein